MGGVRNMNMNVHITNKKAVRFVLIAVMMIFLIVGVVLVCSGLWFKNYDKGVKERCTESVQAVVDGYQSSSSRHSDGTYSTSYFPVFNYTYNGIDYTKQSNYGSGEPKYSKGDVVEIKVNPNDATEFFNPSDRSDIVYNVLMGIGLSFILIVVVVSFGVYLINKRRKELEDRFN